MICKYSLNAINSQRVDVKIVLCVYLFTKIISITHAAANEFKSILVCNFRNSYSYTHDASRSKTKIDILKCETCVFRCLDLIFIWYYLLKKSG